MHRRDFCKLLAVAAASKGVPSYGQTAQVNPLGMPSGFNRYMQDYAQFCALPPEKRVFYKVSDGKIIEERLDEATWEPPAWNYSPASAVCRGWAYGTTCPWSRQSPTLQATARSSPRGILCSIMKRRIGTAMPSSVSGLTGVRSACPKLGTGTRAICISRANGNISISLNTIGPPSRFGYKELCAQWTLLNWDPDELVTRYKKAGARIFVALANHHDGFDAWDSKHQPWNAARSAPIATSLAHGLRQRESRVYDLASQCIRRVTGGGFSHRMAPTNPVYCRRSL